MALPRNTDEMRLLLHTEHLVGLMGVRDAQRQLSEWMVDAALERDPRLLVRGLSLDEVHRYVVDACTTRWKSIGTLIDDLNRAERALLAEMGPIA